jgi:hypothetical protein
MQLIYRAIREASSGRNSMRAQLLSIVVVTLAVVMPLRAARGQDTATLPNLPRELTPEVRKILEAGGHEAHMLRNYLNYANALRAGGDALDLMVLPDVKLNDLEPAGFIGLEGLKAFRQGQNTSMSYDRVVVRSISFPAPDMTDVDLCTERTDVATGAKVTFVVYARDRWVGDKVAERWHRREVLPAGSDCGPGDPTSRSR